MGIGEGSGGAVAGLGVLACCVWDALSMFVVSGKVGEEGCFVLGDDFFFLWLMSEHLKLEIIVLVTVGHRCSIVLHIVLFIATDCVLPLCTRSHNTEHKQDAQPTHHLYKFVSG